MPLLNRTLNLAKKLSLYIFIAVIAIILSAGPALAEGGYTWIRYMDIGSDQHYWTSLASSADGTKLVATKTNNQGGFLYTSTDSGATWVERLNADNNIDWKDVTSSADGTKLAVISGDYIYTSTDSGITWVERESAINYRNWKNIASSADGTKLVVNSYRFDGSTQRIYIYTSTDSGVTWTEQANDQDNDWTGINSIASSADGTKLALVDFGDTSFIGGYTTYNGGYIYTSTDSGITWTKNTSLNPTLWAGVSSSADGTKLAVVELESLIGERSNQIGYIYTSTDSGVTWTEQTTAGGDGGQYWSEVVSSADGSRLAALDDDDESGEAVLYTAFNPALIPTDPEPEAPDPPATPTIGETTDPNDAHPTTPISMVGDLLAATGVNTLILLALSSVLTVSGIAWAVWEERELTKDGAD